MTIDVLGNIRAAVTKYPLDQRLKLYATVSQRLTVCGLLYVMLNRDTKQDASTSATFEGVGRVYTLAGSITYPETGAPYQKLLEQSSAEILRMKETNDRVKPPIILKSCQEFAGTEQQAASALTRLMAE